MNRTASEIAAEIVEIAEGDVQRVSVTIGEMVEILVASGDYAANEIGEIVAAIVDAVTALNAWRATA
jgi:hypothetical protein